MICSIYLVIDNLSPSIYKNNADVEILSAVNTDHLTVEVTLEKQYIDGHIEVEKTSETISSMEDFWANYLDWELVDQTDGLIHFRKEVNDISPYLKTYGYFGLNNSVLTIFEGTPIEEKAIQSFYHIDTEELESHLFQELNKGIKIKTKEDYENVLETFRNYNDTKEVSG
jgi:forespore regulator of the sigma-K checkpoint